jgi:hypothetical protein
MEYGKVVFEKGLECWKIVEVKNLGKVEFRRVQEIWERWNSKRIQKWCKMAENGYNFGQKKSNKCKLKDWTIALR